MSNKKKRILIIGSYPIVKPIHGGQRRSHEILKNYINLGFDAEFVGAYLESNYSKDKRAANDIVISNKIYQDNLDFINYLIGFEAREDIVIPKLIVNLKKLSNKLNSMISNFDIIHFEQPFMFQAVNSKILENKTIIFGSHNIEEDLFEHLTAKKYVKKITTDLLKVSKFIIVCSENEKQYYLKIDKYKQIIEIPNAVSPKTTDQLAQTKIKNLLDKEKISQYLLFVSSAHEPNFKSFMKIIGFKLGFLEDEQYIVVAGNLGYLMKMKLEESNDPRSAIIENKVKYFCELNDDELQALIDQATGIILPIVYGSGSNLKTAEALYSSKNIIATSFGFRGYEKYMKSSNVKISDKSDEFTDYMMKAFNQKTSSIDYDKNKLTWQYSFKQNNKKLKGLIDE